MAICNSSDRCGRAGVGRRAGPGRRLVLALALLGLAAPAAAQTGADTGELECLVEPFLEVKISSGIPGILAEVAVDRGDMVRKGQILARLRSEVEQAAYDLALARAEFAARQVERNKELYRKQMISSHEKDELETQAQLLRLEMQEAAAVLERRTITSPVDGVVVRRHSSPGEYVQDEPFLELAQLDPLRVEVAVPVSRFGRVRAGMAARVTWQVPGVGTHRARVETVDPVVDAASGTIGVRLTLPNPGGRLPAGTQCQVGFVEGEGAAR